MALPSDCVKNVEPLTDVDQRFGKLSPINMPKLGNELDLTINGKKCIVGRVIGMHTVRLTRSKLVKYCN